MRKNNRIYYLDILRVIACLSVVLNHSSAIYVDRGIGSVNFWIAGILDGFVRIGVPMFVMISGALMLDRNYEYTPKKLKKRVVKMAVFFVCWSVIYCLIYGIAYPLIIEHRPVDFAGVVDSLIIGHYHLWFIYLIIGLYLIVPLLRLWVTDENKKYVEYFLLLSFVFAFIIPQIISITGNYTNALDSVNYVMEKNLQLRYVGGYTSFFILGWYFHNYEIKNKKAVYILGIAGLLVTVFGTYILSRTTGRTVKMYDNLSLNVLFQTVAVFVFVKDRFMNAEPPNRAVSSVAKYSLGIYATHALFIALMYKVLDKAGIDFALITIPVVFTATLALGYLSSYILSRIPGFRKIV
ncbi:MAG: acyltransferase family protein [Oscillospiraceae bacterium]|nr:acyltransferase family protein [Oscillospiraceae bacterium]